MSKSSSLVPSVPNENRLGTTICELWNYYQSMYDENPNQIISAFKTQLFSGPLQTGILEIEVNEELQSKTEAFWNFCDESICLPEVYVNISQISALIVRGASSSVISLKLAKAEIIQSLKLVFKPDPRKMKMANGVEVESQCKIENLPIQINELDSSVSPRVMGDLSYDFILGRDCCEANGVIIDFAKQKIYMIMNQQEGEQVELINPLETQYVKTNWLLVNTRT